MATGLFNLKQVNQAISQGAWSGYIAPKWVEYLVVAGGGGGGTLSGGGGGAGGLLTGIVTVTAGTSYTVTVGAGGSAGSNGVSSVFGAISGTGGGAGGQGNGGTGASAGSGGGGGYNVSLGGNGTSGQGFAGGAGTVASTGGAGGGGGAGTVGLPSVSAIGGNGGAGIASAITGSVVTYAGGGGGVGRSPSAGGTGGVGGGGSGASSATGTAGGGNTGGGGGDEAAGGSGIVVVRYPGSIQFFTGGTLSYANGYMIHTFYASGTLAPTTPTPYVTDYQISRSLRFNSADSAYLSRTFSASNRRTWTWSGWVKRSAINGTYQNIFQTSGAAGGDNDYFSFRIMNGEQIGVVLYSYFPLISTQVLRDTSAWYHFVCALDTTQATATNRLRIYINGVEVTAWSTDNRASISQNATLGINSAAQHNIGAYQGSSEFFSGYATEINFVDGQALTPSSFGYTNPATGVWSPLAFVGTYGTNGFELNFSDNSNTTAATLGADYSGNGNNWTPNNFSVTAGAGNDSLVDSPTSYGTDTGVGGTVRGNYCTWNPLSTGGGVVLSNGNLRFSKTSSTCIGAGTIFVSSGKWYAEYTCTSSVNMVGVIRDTDSPRSMDYVGFSANSYGYYYNGNKFNNNTNAGYGSSYTTNDVIGIALDMDAGTIAFYKNGTSQGTAYSGLSGNFTVASGDNVSVSGELNTGQRPFAYTAPSGFKALCTQNLPTPTIGATSATLAAQFFAPVTYTGTSATQSVTVGFQPDFVWIKNRTSALAHYLNDSVRGPYQTLFSNLTNAEYNGTSNSDGVSTFNSNSFTLLNGTNASNYNASSNNYVAWNWRASGTTVSNTSGSITSTVSANTTSGFSVVTYSGNGTNNSTVGHGLGVTPSMVILKSRTGGTKDWRVYHSGLTAGYNIALNTSAAQYQGSSGNAGYISAVASTTFTLTQSGADVLDAVNASGQNYVAYCFAEVSGYSKFGSWTGNGSSDGPFVFTGFKPAYILWKRTDSSTGGDWGIVDATRNPSNVVGEYLAADTSGAGATYSMLDMVSNGFKIRWSDTSTNASGGTYIFMAFASAPLKFSLAR